MLRQRARFDHEMNRNFPWSRKTFNCSIEIYVTRHKDTTSIAKVNNADTSKHSNNVELDSRAQWLGLAVINQE